MGINERKERNKQEMRKQILSTAMKLFLEEGFQNVSIRRIADNIEYSPATIYLYFKDKDDILFALHNAGFEELYKRQQEILAIKDPKKRLRKHGEVYIKFALENPEYYNLMFIMRGPAKKIVESEEWNVGMRSYDLFKRDVEASMRAGIIKKSDIDVATFAMWSLAHGVVSLILRNRCTMMDPKDLPSIAQKAFEYIMKNIGISP
ncbi:MAG: TetR/AcrR family transcriptional regulator [Ignavibacteria bacterium]|nr:TetR/AcrR family transcriptional regulator [Ignavibacteria bacterium]